jgi:hypothetical protein
MTAELRAHLERALQMLGTMPADPVRALHSVGIAHPVLAERGLVPATGIDGWTAEAAVPSTSAGKRSIPAEREPVSFTLVSLGGKPMLLEHGPAADMADLARHALTRGLAALFGPYAFEPERDGKRHGYSNRMQTSGPLAAGGGSWRGLLISPDPRCAVLGWLALAAGWDRLLGRLLGYPACCADAFAMHWPTDRARWQGDPGSRLLATPRDWCRPLPWRSNVFARYRAPCLIEHFPCRFDCPETLAMAHRAERSLNIMRPDVAEAARGAMRSIVYEDADGIEVVPGAALIDGMIAPSATTLGTRLAGLRVTPGGLWRDGERVDARFAAFTADTIEEAGA